MALELIGLEAVIAGVSSYLSDADAISRSTEGIGTSTEQAADKSGLLANVLGGAGTLALTAFAAAAAAAVAATVAIGGAAFAAAVQLDGAFDDIQTGTGATGAELKELKDSFRDVFATVPADAGAVSDVLTELNRRLDLSGDVLEDTAATVLEFSRLTGGDATMSTQLLTRVMGDWGIANEDTAKTLDLMFMAGQETGASIDGLMQKAVQFGAPMRLMGFSLEDTIALLGKWEQEGVNTELVMGSLRIAAGKFADAGKPLRDSLLETFDSIQNNTDATAALALGMDVFGARAGPDMVAAIREGRFEFEDLLVALEGSEGAILETADATADFGEKFTLLKNQATLALEPLGMSLMNIAGIILDRLGPIIENILPTLTKVGEGIGAAFELLITRVIAGGGRLVEIFQLGGFQQLFTVFEDGSNYIGNFLETLGLSEPVAQRVGAAIASLGQWVTGVAIPALQEFGNWFMNIALPAIIPVVQVIIAQLVPGLIQLGVWIGQLASFLLPLLIQWWGFLADHLNIVLPIVGAVIAVIIAINAPIVAVIGVLVLLATAWANNWGGIQEKVEAVWAVIGPLIETAMQNIQTTITMVLTAVQTFWAAHGETILATATAIWGAIRDYITTSINQIQAIVQFISNAIQVFWASWGNTILAVAENTWNAILETIDNVILIIQGIVDIFVGAFTGDWELFGEGLRKVWDGVWAEVVTILETAWANISEIIGQLIEEIISFFSNTDWGSVGRNIIDGIKNGIQNAASGLAQAAANAAAAALDAAKAFLGIDSPSKIFEKVGMNVVQGMIEGIQSLQPKLAAQMQFPGGLIAPLAPALAYAGGVGGSTTTNNNTFNTSVYSPMSQALFESKLRQAIGVSS